MKSATQIQIVDRDICISLYVNAIWKGMNPSILHQAMVRLGNLALKNAKFKFVLP